MMQLRSLTVLLIVFAAMSSAAAQSTAQKRDIVLDLTLTNGAAPQLRISEGQTGTIEIPDVGKFGFVPTLNDGVVFVEIFDLTRTPHRQIARLEVTVGGDRVQSDTTPKFGVRVPRVITR